MDRYYYHFSSHLGGDDLITFHLRDEHKRKFSDPAWPDCNAIKIAFYPDISINKEELLEKFNTCTSLKKRIYIKGALRGGAGGPPRCPDSIYPRILLKSLDDIFESDKKDDNEQNKTINH